MAVACASQAIDSTDTAIGDLKAAGTPDTPNGAKIQAGLLKGFSEAKQVFAEAEASAEQLSTTNATTFATQATTIGNQISASSGKIESAFGKLDKLDKGGALQKVVKKTRACKFLGS